MFLTDPTTLFDKQKLGNEVKARLLTGVQDNEQCKNKNTAYGQRKTKTDTTYDQLKINRRETVIYWKHQTVTSLSLSINIFIIHSEHNTTQSSSTNR